MNSRHLTLIIIGSVLVGLGFGTVPHWVWIPFTVFVGIALLSTLWQSHKEK